MNTDWMDDAACASVDPDLFFPGRGEDVRPAKAVCAVCPVRARCLDHALAEHEVHGVWGGTSENERRKIRSERHRAAPQWIGQRERILAMRADGLSYRQIDAATGIHYKAVERLCRSVTAGEAMAG